MKASDCGYYSNSQDYAYYQKKDNPGFWKKSKAAAAGTIAASAAASAVSIPVSLAIMNKMIKVNRSISPEEVKILNDAGKKIMESSGLASKGVKIVKDIDPKGKGRKVINEFMKYFKLPKKVSSFIKSFHPFYSVKLGRNACFDPEKNLVAFSNKMALSQFHEMGHAMNKYGKIGSLFQSARQDLGMKMLKMGKLKGANKYVALAAGLTAAAVSTVALFKNKKAEGEEPKGFFDKAGTMIKNNVGKLTFLTMLPIAVEEALASFKGEKAVKNLINPELFKKVKFTNRLGLATYVIATVGAGVAMRLATNIRDKIAQPNTK